MNSSWSIHGPGLVGQAENSHATIEVKDRGRLLSDGPIFSVGEGSQSKGRLSVVSSTQSSEVDVALNSTLRVGVHGTGEVFVGDAGSLNAKSVLLGVEPGGNGSVEVSGANASMGVFNSFEVGGLGVGKVDVKGGGKIIVKGSSGMTIDSAPSVTTASVTVAGKNASGVGDGSYLQAELLRIGLGGRGALTADDEGSIFSTKLQIAVDQGSHGTVTTKGAGGVKAENLKRDSEGRGDQRQRRQSVRETNHAGGVRRDGQRDGGRQRRRPEGRRNLGPQQDLDHAERLRTNPATTRRQVPTGGSAAHPATLNVVGAFSDVSVDSDSGKGAGSFEPGAFAKRSSTSIPAGRFISQTSPSVRPRILLLAGRSLT